MKDLYTTIIQRLTSMQAKEAYHKAGVLPCRFVDFYRGQYFQFENFDTFPLPAVLFEFSLNYNSKREGTATITLHLCYEQPMETSSISKIKENALKFFDFVNTTHNLLDGLESKHTGKLLLNMEEMVKDDTIVNVHLLTFSCLYTGRNTEKYTYVTGEDLLADGKITYNLDS